MRWKSSLDRIWSWPIVAASCLDWARKVSINALFSCRFLRKASACFWASNFAFFSGGIRTSSSPSPSPPLASPPSSSPDSASVSSSTLFRRSSSISIDSSPDSSAPSSLSCSSSLSRDASSELVSASSSLAFLAAFTIWRSSSPGTVSWVFFLPKTGASISPRARASWASLPRRLLCSISALVSRYQLINARVAATTPLSLNFRN
mmetsp:Transcript_1858/g.4135  ORF Transcript_1858/g.4135 Transcript_1858/m.4135 type:complete len:205 (+) Transcript_1858:592-1206(+)